MDGFGEYRSDLLLRVSSQSTSEAVLNQEAAAIRALSAARIEIKIDQITQKSGDIFQKWLDFLFLVFLRAFV